MANVQVARSTYQAITGEGIQVREIGDRIALLDRDVTPLLVMSINAKRKKPSKSPRIEQIEDDVRGLWDYHASNATISSVATGILVSDGTLFAAGDLVAVQKANSSSAAEEIVRVTAISSNTLTVTRNIGGAGADSINVNQALRIIGSAFAEGADLGSVRSTTKTTITSYTQIFREPIKITGTMQATEVYGEPDEEYQIAKAQIELKKSIEAAGLWGRASESLAAPASVRTTMGFKSRVSTNVNDMATTATLTKWNTVSETAFRYSQHRKLLIAAPAVHSGINYFAQNALQTQVESTVFGVNIKRLVLPHGELLLAPNWLMEAGVAAQAGYNDEFYIIDLEAVTLYYLNGNGVNRDVALYRDVVKAGADATTHEVRGELAWIFVNEKKHSRGFNCSSYA